MNNKKIYLVIVSYRGFTSYFYSYRTKNARDRSRFFSKNNNQLNHHYSNIFCRSYYRTFHFNFFQKKEKIDIYDIHYHLLIDHHLFSAYTRQIRIFHNIKYFLILYWDFLRYRSKSARRQIFLPYRR